MGSGIGQPADNLVSLCDQFLDCVVEVRKSAADEADIIAKARSSPDNDAQGTAERHVSGDQFVGQVQIPQVPQLVIVVPDDGLVRLDGGGSHCWCSAVGLY